MIFNPQKNISGFTLIEMMIVIAIMWIAALWAARVDFNRISDAERGGIFANKIASKMETIRNNSLIGKWVWAWLITPNVWQIEVSNTLVKTSYDISGELTASADESVPIISPYEISEIYCVDLDGNKDITSTATLSFIKNSLSLSGCSDTNHKILEITTRYKTHEKVITINTLSWLIGVD